MLQVSQWFFYCLVPQFRFLFYLLICFSSHLYYIYLSKQLTFSYPLCPHVCIWFLSFAPHGLQPPILTCGVMFCLLLGIGFLIFLNVVCLIIGRETVCEWSPTTRSLLHSDQILDSVSSPPSLISVYLFLQFPQAI